MLWSKAAGVGYWKVDLEDTDGFSYVKHRNELYPELVLEHAQGNSPFNDYEDTPRFAPYIRYASSWEYLTRMLGLTVTEQSLGLKPFKTIPFSFTDIQIAGVKLSVRVEAGWNTVIVDGKKVDGTVILNRAVSSHSVAFLHQ